MRSSTRRGTSATACTIMSTWASFAVAVLVAREHQGAVVSAFSVVPPPSAARLQQPRTAASLVAPSRGSIALWSSPAASSAAPSSTSGGSDSDSSDDGPDHHGSPDHRTYVLDLSRYATTAEFNAELELLSRRCVDDVPGKKEDVIGCAALAEAMLTKWEEKVEEALKVAGEAEEGAGDGGGANSVAERIRSEIVRPDVTSYNLVIRAWSKACSTLAEGRGRGTILTNIGTDLSNVNVYSAKDAAARAEEVLTSLETRYLDGLVDIAPVASSYNAAIDAWAKSRTKDAAARAEAVLDRMKYLSDGREGSSGRVNAAKPKWERCAPDIVSYNSVMEAWAHSTDDPDALRKARNALDMLNVKYDKTGDARIKPNIRTVNQVINCYAKRGAYEPAERISGASAEDGEDDGDDDGSAAAPPMQNRGRGDGERAWSAARRAEKLLNDMTQKYLDTSDPDFKPDATTYTSCCDAYGRVGDVAASERAESLLNRVEKMYNETGDVDVKPNYRTYTAVIGGWSKTRDEQAPRRAEAILRHMELLHAEAMVKGKRTGGRSGSVKPNSRTYTTVINAWVRSKDPLRAQHSLRILKKMLDLHKAGDAAAGPTLYTYNAVMEACAKCRGTGKDQVQALKIAFAVNKALGQSADKAKGVEANHITYCILMKCVQKLLPAGEERNEVAQAVLKKACDAGQVDFSVMRQLQMATDRTLFYDLCESFTNQKGFVDFNEVPLEWRRNVRR